MYSGPPPHMTMFPPHMPPAGQMPIATAAVAASSSASGKTYHSIFYCCSSFCARGNISCPKASLLCILDQTRHRLHQQGRNGLSGVCALITLRGLLCAPATTPSFTSTRLVMTCWLRCAFFCLEQSLCLTSLLATDLPLTLGRAQVIQRLAGCSAGYGLACSTRGACGNYIKSGQLRFSRESSAYSDEAPRNFDNQIQISFVSPSFISRSRTQHRRPSGPPSIKILLSALKARPNLPLHLTTNLSSVFFTWGRHSLLQKTHFTTSRPPPPPSPFLV